MKRNGTKKKKEEALRGNKKLWIKKRFVKSSTCWVLARKSIKNYFPYWNLFLFFILRLHRATNDMEIRLFESFALKFASGVKLLSRWVGNFWIIAIIFLFPRCEMRRKGELLHFASEKRFQLSEWNDNDFGSSLEFAEESKRKLLRMGWIILRMKLALLTIFASFMEVSELECFSPQPPRSRSWGRLVNSDMKMFFLIKVSSSRRDAAAVIAGEGWAKNDNANFQLMLQYLNDPKGSKAASRRANLSVLSVIVNRPQVSVNFSFLIKREKLQVKALEPIAACSNSFELIARLRGKMLIPHNEQRQIKPHKSFIN